MKNPDLMMYRVAIGQILADAGINRETIKDMVQQSIDEKIDRQLPGVLQKAILDLNIRHIIDDDLRNQLQQAVRRELSWLSIDVNIRRPDTEK